MPENTSRPRRTTSSRGAKPTSKSARPQRSSSRSADGARRKSTSRTAPSSGRRDAGATSSRNSARPVRRGSSSSETSKRRDDSVRTSSSRTGRPKRDGERSGSSHLRRDDSRRSGKPSETRSRVERTSRDSRGRTERPRRDEERSGSARPRREDSRRSGKPSETRSRVERTSRDSRGRTERPRRDEERSGSSRPRREDSRRSGQPRESRTRDSRDSRTTSRTRRDDSVRSSGSRKFESKRPASPRQERSDSFRRTDKKFDAPKPTLDIPKDIDVSIVPKSVMAEIRLIAPHTQDLVKQYLAVAITLIESADFERAYDYAKEARNLASRLATVREIAGLAAYYAGKWAEALSEFKTYMRMTGDPHFLPIMADCERGLNRPERAIALSKNRSVQDLDAAGKIEMRIVVSGARRDLRQFDTALAILEVPELRSGKRSPEVARLRYAYAEVLLALGRKVEARDWFVKASLADVDEETDASERALKLGEI